MRASVLLGFLTGCFPGTSAPTDSPASGGDAAEAGDSGADTARPCHMSFTTFPAEGAVDWYYRENLKFELSKPDATATIETTIPGQQTVSADGKLLSWELLAPLTPSTAYTVTLHSCSGDSTVHFTTSALGEPLAHPDELVGRVYALDLGNARFLKPEGIGSLLQSEAQGEGIYLAITDVGASSIGLVGASSREQSAETGAGGPEYCDPTLDFPAADFSSSPHVDVVQPGQVIVRFAGFPMLASDLHMTGDFSADGLTTGGGTMEALLDTRPTDEAYFDGEIGSVCTTMESIGTSCDACPDGGVYCIAIEIDRLSGAVTDSPLSSIVGDNCLGCTAGMPVDSSATCPTE